MRVWGYSVVACAHSSQVAVCAGRSLSRGCLLSDSPPPMSDVVPFLRSFVHMLNEDQFPRKFHSLNLFHSLE